jgi:hypothetical protein
MSYVGPRIQTNLAGLRLHGHFKHEFELNVALKLAAAKPLTMKYILNCYSPIPPPKKDTHFWTFSTHSALFARTSISELSPGSCFTLISMFIGLILHYFLKFYIRKSQSQPWSEKMSVFVCASLIHQYTPYIFHSFTIHYCSYHESTILFTFHSFFYD